MGQKYLLISTALWALAAPVTAAHAQSSTYLSPIIGTGTDEDPYRAHRAGISTICTDLRANVALATGYMLCRGPAVPAQLGVIGLPDDDSTRLSAGLKVVLQPALGKAVAADTLSELVGEVARAKGLKLRLSKEGTTRIAIGGKQMWEAPVARSMFSVPDLRTIDALLHLPFTILSKLVEVPKAWAASYNENWNCADNSAGVSCQLSWNNFQGTAMGILSNQANTTNTVATQGRRMTSNLATDDMAVGATLAILTRNSATANEAGPIVRKEANGNSTYYYCMARDISGTDEYELGSLVTGTRTVLAASSTVIPSAGDLIELRVIADQLACYVNGIAVIAPTTDTNISGFLQGGVRTSGSGTANNVAALDDWYALDVTYFPSASSSMRRRLYAPVSK